MASQADVGVVRVRRPGGAEPHLVPGELEVRVVGVVTAHAALRGIVIDRHAGHSTHRVVNRARGKDVLLPGYGAVMTAKAQRTRIATYGGRAGSPGPQVIPLGLVGDVALSAGGVARGTRVVGAAEDIAGAGLTRRYHRQSQRHPRHGYYHGGELTCHA